MKFLFFTCIAFLSVSTNSTAQKLSKGKFSYSGGFVGAGLTVKSNNRFEYNRWSCTGGNRGSGRYVIKDSTLCLVFENEKNIDSILNVKFEPSIKDSTEILLRFKDLKDKSFIDEGVIIQVKKNNKTIGGLVNNSRISSIKIPNDSLPINLDIRCILYGDRHITIDSSGKYSILCSLEDNFLKTYALGDSLFFILNKYNRKQIQMRANDEEPGYFNVYFRNRNWLQKILWGKRNYKKYNVVQKVSTK